MCKFGISIFLYIKFIENHLAWFFIEIFHKEPKKRRLCRKYICLTSVTHAKPKEKMAFPA